MRRESVKANLGMPGFAVFWTGPQSAAVARLLLSFLVAALSLVACGRDECPQPPSTEICDGRDNDLDGQVDEDFDRDGDGYAAGSGCLESLATDCDDDDAEVHPGAFDICDDDIDQDCDGRLAVSGTWYQDDDADGYGKTETAAVACLPATGTASLSGDCDDTDARVNPGADETTSSLEDLNCDGEVSFVLDSATGVADLAIYSPLFGTVRFDVPAGSVQIDARTAPGALGSQTEVTVTVGLSPLNQDTELLLAASVEQALLSPILELSPDLRFAGEPAVVTWDFDAAFYEAVPQSTCDWVALWQLDHESGASLDAEGRVVACDLRDGSLAVAMEHFSTYQVRGSYPMLVFEPEYQPEDLDPGPLVRAVSDVAFSREWTWRLAGRPVSDLSEAIDLEPWPHSSDLSTTSAGVTWNPETSRYHLTLEIHNRGHASPQLEMIVWASSSRTPMAEESLCPLQKPNCTAGAFAQVLTLPGAQQVSCGSACAADAACYDLDGDSVPDPLDCLWVEVKPDPTLVDDDGDGFSEQEGDCDDADPSRNPDSLWYQDADGDGYGDPSFFEKGCDPIAGYVTDGSDCNDASPAFHPGAMEEDCSDPNDYNCDGSVAYEDRDGDGFAACQECADDDPAINPGALEVCDGVDNDCDGRVDVHDDELDSEMIWYLDGDADGYGTEGVRIVASECDPPEGYAGKAGDCDDGDADLNPSAEEACDAIDNNCDGTVDEGFDIASWYLDLDGDGFGGGNPVEAGCAPDPEYLNVRGDCDDDDASVHPGMNDSIGDGIDSDCGGTDEAEPHVGFTSSTFDTIQSALDAALPGAVIWVGPGTYFEHDLSFNGKAVTLVSTHFASNTMIDAEQKSRVMVFENGEGPDSVLDGFTLTGGEAAYICVADHHCGRWGGGILMVASSPTLIRGTIARNYAMDGGGGMYLHLSEATLALLTLLENTAANGGGMHLSVSNPTMNQVALAANSASVDGGGLYLDTSSPALAFVTLSGNQATGNGGGLCLYESTPSLSHVTLNGNSTEHDGGGCTCRAQVRA